MNNQDAEDRKARPAKVREASRDDECERLIRKLEAEALQMEREAKKAAREAAKPHGLLGKLGFETSTG
jgi:hypothetical protein